MNFYIFRAETILCDPSPLDWRNKETRQLNGIKSPCRRFYYIDRATKCFRDIPSFRSKLSKILSSIIRWFDPLEKGAKQAAPKIPLRRFYYLHQSQYSDMSWHSIHILVTSIGLFFDDFLLASSNEMETWRSPDPASESPCHSYLREWAKCAWLQSLSWIAVSIFRIFHSWIIGIEIDTLDAYPKEDLWSCLFLRVN